MTYAVIDGRRQNIILICESAWMNGDIANFIEFNFISQRSYAVWIWFETNHLTMNSSHAGCSKCELSAMRANVDDGFS